MTSSLSYLTQSDTAYPHIMTRPTLRFSLILALFLACLALYSATYSARIESSDSWRVVDAASSLVNFGDILRDESFWISTSADAFQPQQWALTTYEANEPLAVYATALLYALARHVPVVGQVHAVWLLNIIVIALSISLFYILGRLLNYDHRTVIIAAACLACATTLWVYSKTLFREPLVMLFLLLVTIFIEKWRQKYHHVIWLALASIMMILAFLTKNSSIVALPALIMYALPNRKMSKGVHYALIGALITIVIALVTIAQSQEAMNTLIQWLQPLRTINGQYSRIALHSYVLSIGASLWGTSPVLLLSIVGAAQLLIKRQHRLVWFVLTLVSTYALSHAFLTEVHWFGGLSYPPRFLQPTIPFVMLLTLPLFADLLSRKNRLLRLLTAALILFSIAIQGIAALSLTDAYGELLPAAANGLVEWSPGFDDFRYLRWRLLPQSWAHLGWDVAWSRIGQEWIMFAFLLVPAAYFVLMLFRRQWIRRFNWIAALYLIALWAFALDALYHHDSRYWADTPQLTALLTTLEEQTHTVEPLFFASGADNTYERFVLNYNKSTTIRPIGLGFQAGDRASSSDTPGVSSDYTPNLFHFYTLPIIDHTANQHDRLWWLAHNSFFLTWTTRPEERYLSENYYLVQQYTTDDPTARLLAFDTTRAPNPYQWRLPQQRISARFGEHITLMGVTLPHGEIYQVGQTVPITFFWQTDQLIPINYTVAWFLVATDGTQILHGIDSMPVNNFAPTSIWRINQPVLDNRAIEIPLDAATGDYQIWLRLYQSDDSQQQLPVTNVPTYENTTAILPINITISAAAP